MTRSKRIAEQLGMSHGAAANRLRKNLLYEFVKLAEQHFCFKCGAEIENVNEFSIEHKLPWEGRDANLFWSLDNIAFSHAHCNRPHTTTLGRSFRGATKDTKWCPRCEQILPLDKFRKHINKPKGRYTYCKICAKEKDTRKNHRKR